MEIMEIILLIVGGIIFILSFLAPDKGETSEETKGIAKEEIALMVGREMDSIRGHVDDVVEEAVTYAVEKTERSLERLTNEKIMAVNEYSDTVLAEIHKNHEEAMFLYDMLNSKHNNLKNTVSEVNRTVKKAEETVSDFKQLNAETEAARQDIRKTIKEAEKKNSEKKNSEKTDSAKKDTQKPDVPKHDSKKSDAAPNIKTEKVTAPKQKETVGRVSFLQENESDGRNNNDRILELYSQGKSNIAIAKELGLGVGEVKLVIDLFKTQ